MSNFRLKKRRVSSDEKLTLFADTIAGQARTDLL